MRKDVLKLSILSDIKSQDIKIRKFKIAIKGYQSFNLVDTLTTGNSFGLQFIRIN